MFRKSACPSGQVKTEMYLPESPFFKNSLAGPSGLVLMSVPGLKLLFLLLNPIECGKNNNETTYVTIHQAFGFYIIQSNMLNFILDVRKLRGRYYLVPFNP